LNRFPTVTCDSYTFSCAQVADFNHIRPGNLVNPGNGIITEVYAWMLTGGCMAGPPWSLVRDRDMNVTVEMP
jgi:hypothetical protein